MPTPALAPELSPEGTVVAVAIATATEVAVVDPVAGAPKLAVPDVVDVKEDENCAEFDVVDAAEVGLGKMYPLTWTAYTVNDVDMLELVVVDAPLVESCCIYVNTPGGYTE
jgi:hypothetical protein